jgi:hypothetical protein
MSKHVEFPLFELVGPSCKENDCKGTLIDTYALKEKILYKKCSVCQKKFPLEDFLEMVK